jgi:hypothetical protein
MLHPPMPFPCPVIKSLNEIHGFLPGAVIDKNFLYDNELNIDTVQRYVKKMIPDCKAAR